MNYRDAVIRLKTIPDGDSFHSVINEVIKISSSLFKTKSFDLYFIKKKSAELDCWYRQSQGKNYKESLAFAESCIEHNSFYNCEYTAAYPLSARNETFGAVVLGMNDERIADADKAAIFFDYFALLLYNAKVSLLANKDKLTQIFNRGYLNNTLQKWEEEGEGFSIMLLDIDKFKHYNDNYGHPVGDHVLKTFSALIKKNVKGMLFGRFGGEEFLLAWKKTDKDKLCELMERVRVLIERHDFSTSQFMLRVSVSIGASVKDRPDKSLRDIISEADEALYSSKRNGRNRATLYGQE